jgi:hypothetical protein
VPLSFAQTPDSKANAMYLNEIKDLDILTLNANLFRFRYIVERRGNFQNLDIRFCPIVQRQSAPGTPQ